MCHHHSSFIDTEAQAEGQECKNTIAAGDGGDGREGVPVAPS